MSIKSLNSAPKPLKLWIITRDTARVLSGIEPLTLQFQDKIREDVGMTITKKDINDFPLVLKRFPHYPDVLYRGLFTYDTLLNNLLREKEVLTQRYLSFTKKLSIAKQYGSKMVMVLMKSKNYDISVYSKEMEVIVDKGLELRLIGIEYDGEYKLFIVSM